MRDCWRKIFLFHPWRNPQQDREALEENSIDRSEDKCPIASVSMNNGLI